MKKNKLLTCLAVVVLIVFSNGQIAKKVLADPRHLETGLDYTYEGMCTTTYQSSEDCDKEERLSESVEQNIQPKYRAKRGTLSFQTGKTANIKVSIPYYPGDEGDFALYSCSAEQVKQRYPCIATPASKKRPNPSVTFTNAMLRILETGDKVELDYTIWKDGVPCNMDQIIVDCDFSRKQ